MIGLGLWQLLIRRPDKLAYVAQLQANPAKPPVAFPREPDEALLFRRATGLGLETTAIRTEGAGRAGFRLIAECRTGGRCPHPCLFRPGFRRAAWPGAARHASTVATE